MLQQANVLMIMIHVMAKVGQENNLNHFTNMDSIRNEFDVASLKTGLKNV